MSENTEIVVKRCRKSGEDCISNLPESIISHILSCLPTKDAVQTSVLSKDWEFKWTSIYDIQIEDYSRRVHNKASFVNFVERILLLTHNISSFCLHCLQECDLTRLISWISAVLRRNLENFELHYHATEGLLLPRSLLNCTSLRSLKLYLFEYPCTFKVPSQNCFPNLVNLFFTGVEIRNDLSSSDTLTFTFPVLETLVLRECKWLNVKFVEINAPALTKFLSVTLDYEAQVDDYSINIVGSRLKDFESSGELPENLFLTGSSVTHAAFSNMEETWDFHLLESGLQVRKLLNGFQSLEDLRLSGWIAKTIARSEQGLALPKYNKLRRLSLDGCTDIEVLLELLHAAPYLKSLAFEMLFQSTQNDFEVVDPLPYCLLNHLEEVEFSDYFFPDMYDFRLEKFLLKNGLRLKAFHLRCGDKKNEMVEILKLLVTFPKGSDCLSFVIH